jgi:hypothetical protein
MKLENFLRTQGSLSVCLRQQVSTAIKFRAISGELDWLGREGKDHPRLLTQSFLEGMRCLSLLLPTLLNQE